MELFPPMPLASWQDTKQTLHRFCQVIGKIRLAASVRRNHWWNVPFHLTGRGITTRPMGQVDGNPSFTIDFDFIDHQLRIHTLDGRALAVPLQGQSVASFHNQTLQALAELGISVTIAHPHPFDLPDADRPFADDSEHASYDPAWATRYWQVLSQVNLVLEEFAARFSGKVSPVHHFWHTFDIAHTRFSDRHVDQPTGLADQPLQPAAAWWDPRDGSHLAVLRYDDARASDDPRATVLDFYESAYRAGAGQAGWDIGRLACPGGITDPHLRRHQDQS
jgi:hypothetical protein